MENNQEFLAKAKEAKTPGELLSLAKENGIEMTDELADDELNNVSGGGCRKSDGRLVVSAGYSCGYWECNKCGVKWKNAGYGTFKCSRCGKSSHCNNCYWCSYEKGLWLCNNKDK